MADSIIITANVTDGAIINSNVTESTAVTANVVTGAKGDKGDTGATGAAGVVQAVTDGTGIDVDATDPASPIVSLDPASIASLALADSAIQSLSDLSITSTAAELNYTDGVTSAIQTQLDGKSATSHTHTAADTTDFDTEVSNNTDVAANTAARHTHANSAVLDATTASFTTADETKLDGIAIGAQVNTVTSVNTRTGAVTGLAEASDLTAHTGNTSNPHSVTKAQVGLGNVDNTSDANKPVSTAQAASIALKANASDTVNLTGNQTIAGVKTFTSAPIAPSGTSIGGVLHLTGSGFPNGVVSASVGSIYIDTAVTNGASSWIKKSGTGSTGWQVLEGNTGWRNVTSSLINGWTAGEFLLRRIGSQVYLRTEALNAATMTSASPYTLPSGFRAYSTASIVTSSERQFFTTATNPAAVWRATTPSDGVLYIQGATTGLSVLYGTLQFTTSEDWPTTLPGTAV